MRHHAAALSLDTIQRVQAGLNPFPSSVLAMLHGEGPVRRASQLRLGTKQVLLDGLLPSKTTSGRISILSLLVKSDSEALGRDMEMWSQSYKVS